MKEKASSVALLVMLLLGTLTLAFNSQLVNAEPDTIYVDDDNVAGPWDGSQLHPYQNITSGLEHAASGDTIFVYNGTYYEHISIEKSISLVGQNPLTTIIDGSGEEYRPIVNVFNTTNVIISNLTVQNTSSGFLIGGSGVSMWQSNNITVQNCIATKCYYGILIGNSTNCKILDNKLVNTYAYAIDLRPGSSYNSIISNLIADNPIGIYIEDVSCKNNAFYRNNLNNTKQVDIVFAGPTAWDNGVEGNYWDDYEGTDLDGDGVGDTALPHLWVDSYPLIEIWNKTRIYDVDSNGDSYEVAVNCNYTVASFKFNDTLRQISFYITGPSGWNGYCNVTIPKGLLGPQASEKWIVMLGQNPITYANKSIDKSTRISFNYTLGSSMLENRVRIKVGTLYPPTANFEFAPDPASIIEPVNFTDTSEDSLNGTIVWRQWNFGDGNITETNETLVAHQFESKGVFNVTLTVKDENNLTDSLIKPVRVDNLEPFANFTFSPKKPFVGLEVSFNASISNDVDGIISEYRWDFGDGNVTTTDEAIITHKFEHAEIFNINLTVRDNDGAADSITWTATVGKGETRVEIDASTTVKAEELFMITVTLRDNASQPLAGEQIRFYVYNDETIFSKNSTTDNDGVAKAIFSLSIVGEYSIKAEYKGSEDYLESNSTELITVNLVTTGLTIQAPKNVTQNEELTMSATLLDENESPLYNATIRFYYYNGSIWELLGSFETNQSGVASVNYVPQSAGTFMLKAVFNGTETYAASNSSEHSFTVVAPKIDYTPYIILAAAIATVICVVYIALRRRKKSSNMQLENKGKSSS